MDTKIYTRPVKPVKETESAQLTADKLPNYNFNEYLLRHMMEDQQPNVERKAETKRAEKAEAQKTQNENSTASTSAYHNSATLMASYSMIDRLVSAQNRQQKDEQEAQEMAREISSDDERTL